jgi:hypothetical protein
VQEIVFFVVVTTGIGENENHMGGAACSPVVPRVSIVYGLHSKFHISLEFPVVKPGLAPHLFIFTQINNCGVISFSMKFPMVIPGLPPQLSIEVPSNGRGVVVAAVVSFSMEFPVIIPGTPVQLSIRVPFDNAVLPPSSMDLSITFPN